MQDIPNISHPVPLVLPSAIVPELQQPAPPLQLQSLQTFPSVSQPQLLTATSLSQLEDKALDLIRVLLHNPTLEWTSVGQRLAALAILKGDSDVVAILATGAGKTMLVLLAALMYPENTTVAILPLKSLLLDYQRKLKVMGVPFEIFTISKQHHTGLVGNTSLVLVLVDTARQTLWKEAITSLNQRRPIIRIFIDEGHYAITAANYRPALEFMSELRLTNAQFIIMSGTIPPFSMQSLRKSFDLLPTTSVIRTTTIRPELQYIIDKPQSETQINDKVVELVNAYTPQFTNNDRGLIFVSYKIILKTLVDLLHIPSYKGGPGVIADEEREMAYNSWIEGKSKWMVCTSAFAAGNDYSHVRVIIFAGTPLDFSDYIQSVGRAGRDHKHGIGWILPNLATDVRQTLDQSLHKGFKLLQAMIYPETSTTALCIRYQMSHWTDGQGIKCASDINMVKCSRCNHVLMDSITPLQSTTHSFLNIIINNPLDTRMQKRSAEEPPFPRNFQDASAMAKRQHQMRVGDNDSVANKYLAALNIHVIYCTLERVLSDQKVPHHPITACSALQTQDTPFTSFKLFRESLRYNISGVCFKCSVPQLSDSVHPQFSRGFDGCAHKDVLPPLAFGIWLNKEWRERAQGKFGRTWNSVTEWSVWLCQVNKLYKSNIGALFFWWAGEMEMEEVAAEDSD